LGALTNTAGATADIYACNSASNAVTVTFPNWVQAVLQCDTLNRVTGLATQTTETRRRSPMEMPFIATF
jgi:hypothetical protein